MQASENKREIRIRTSQREDSSPTVQRESLASPLNKRRATDLLKKETKNISRFVKEESIFDDEEKAARDLAFSRISAHSKVNFSKLTENEKIIRYENMMKELTSIRKKYQRVLKVNADPAALSDSVSSFLSNPGDKIFKKARDRLLKEQGFELTDCNFLLDNLSSSIVEGHLIPNSLEFLLMCTLVRKLKKHRSRKVKTEGVPVSMEELQFFNSSTKNDLVSFLTGAEMNETPSAATVPPTPFIEEPINPTYLPNFPSYSQQHHGAAPFFPMHQTFQSSQFQNMNVQTSQPPYISTLTVAPNTSLVSVLSSHEAGAFPNLFPTLEMTSNPTQENILPPLKVDGAGQGQNQRLPSNAVVGLNAEMLKQFNIENKPFQTQDKI